MAAIVDFCRVCTVELDAERIELGYCGKRCRGILRRLARAQELGDNAKYLAACNAKWARREEVRAGVAPSR